MPKYTKAELEAQRAKTLEVFLREAKERSWCDEAYDVGIEMGYTPDELKEIAPEHTVSVRFFIEVDRNYYDMSYSERQTVLNGVEAALAKGGFKFDSDFSTEIEGV